MFANKKKSTTLSDIATAAGVTPMTVSRVVNQNGYVSDGTRDKVLQAIKEMKYRTSEFVRSLRCQQATTIAVRKSVKW